VDDLVPGGPWPALVEERCRQIVAAGRWRRPKSFDARGQRGVLLGDGRPVVSFAGNDYLGLSHHPAVVEAATAALSRWGTGAGASRLVTGSRPVHHDLEDALAAWKGAERAVVFPTGYAANLAVLTTFGEPGVRICSDELNHASIVDGCRLARAEVQVYRHGDAGHLARLVESAPGPVIVVTDTVFSMDGDEAPLAAIADCCRLHGALLVVDEAHGVLGRDPGPLFGGVEHVRVGTLSKTLGALGGFAVGPRRFVELLENRARSYIFTTAPAPADAAAALAALGVLRSAEGDALRARLASNVARLCATAGQPARGSPIVPVVLGAEELAVAASDALLADGLWVPAIRPPTVPPGTARLRVTLSADHEPHEIDRLAVRLRTVGEGLGASAEPGPAAGAPGFAAR
jgi:8-amino-7-oxononanoate synthase